METYTIVSWKKWLESGTLSQRSKTHLVDSEGNTLCGREVPHIEVDVDYSEAMVKVCECKGCMKSNKEAY